MNRRVVAVSAVAAAVCLAGAVTTVARADFAGLVVTVRAAVFVAVGVVVVARRPRHAVGWTLVTSGLLTAVQTASDASARLGVAHGWPTGLVHVLAVSTTWPWFGSLFLPLTVGLLRFPDGLLPGRVWRWTERAALLSIAAFTVGIGVVSATESTADLLADDPAAPTGWRAPVFVTAESMFVIVALCLVLTIASVVVRWRRSTGVELEQIRWVLAAGVVAIATQVTVMATSLPYWAQNLLTAVGYGLIATAVGIAITRYKLYEIDRIVSRTVTYTVVLVVLAGVYTAVLLALAAIVPRDLGQLGVAAATLLVALLAVPLTRRVRRIVDHRFNRSRFDAERIVTRFAADLRTRPDRGDVATGLLDVVARTVQPSSAGVWLVSARDAPVGPRPGGR